MLTVEIYTPEKTVFKGEANAVKLPGMAGGFEVLKDHAPLIAVLGEGSVAIKTAEEIQEYKIESGFVEVLNNQVSVLVEGIA